MIYQDFLPSTQKYVRALVFLLLVGFVASTFSFALYYMVSAREAAGSRIPIRQISVSGEGKVAVKPDVALFHAGVLTQAKKAWEAQVQNSTRSNAILGFLKTQGIEEKDVKTIGYSISPQYRYFETSGALRRPPEIISYEVRHTLEVKVRDLTKLDALLEGVVASGVNEVSAVRFGIDDEEGVRAEARKKAIDDARKRARTLARDLGVRMKRIVSFSESGEGVPIYARASEAGFGVGGVAGEASAPQVAPGEQEIRSMVTITYEFR